MMNGLGYATDRNGYRWFIYENESGREVKGRDGCDYYTSKGEAEYNRPAFTGYHVDKVYYG